jgi:hypothetical protein
MGGKGHRVVRLMEKKNLEHFERTSAEGKSQGAAGGVTRVHQKCTRVTPKLSNLKLTV